MDEGGREPAPPDRAAAAILAVLGERRAGASICPTDAARRLAAENHETDTDGWRRHLATVRRAAISLARSGRIDILRKGRVVDPAELRGVIRLRLREGKSTDSETE